MLFVSFRFRARERAREHTSLERMTCILTVAACGNHAAGETPTHLAGVA